MNPKEFTIWLKGFLAGVSSSDWSDELEAIRDELNAIKEATPPTPQDEQDNWNIYNRTTKAKDILHD